MNTIYWTWQGTIDGKFEALALKEIDDKYAVNVSEFPFVPNEFATKDEAIHYITQLQKPLYYETYGANYELVYVEPNTDQWDLLYYKWERTINEIENLITPWYVKVWRKIKGAFSSSL